MVKGTRDIAISMGGIPNEDYRAAGIELIDAVHPVFTAAQDWPEAHETASARDAVEAFDRRSIFEEIEQIVARERILVVSGCPVCGEVG